MLKSNRGLDEYAVWLIVRALLAVSLALPYRRRVPFIGWFVAKIVAPIAGWNKRVSDNLTTILPEMPTDERARLTRAVLDNFGRALIEGFSGREFIAGVSDIPLQGDGAEALAQAKEAGDPVILVTAHFGNHQALRAALIARGYRVGGLYKPMSNAHFNEDYVSALEKLGEPLFERSPRGLAKMVKFLKSGGMVGMVTDHYEADGTPIPFLGKPAWTALSAAEMALKYDALLIPLYGRRKPDGLGFDLIVEAPVPRSDPVKMTEAINSSLERIVRAHPEQWLWVHRRWKTSP